MAAGTIAAVGVIVPAHNEEDLIGGCLEALGAARERLLRSRPHIRVELCVALDACTDRTAAVVAAFAVNRPWVQVLALDHASVGAARRDAVAAVTGRLAASGDPGPATVWIASTDADTVVPGDWLLEHVRSADLGHDLLLGRVTPSRLGSDQESPAGLVERWARLDAGIGSSVHGANLGVRLSAYLAVGGFNAVTSDEDVNLAAALRSQGWRVTTGSRVQTSSRLLGRTPAGFARYLRLLSVDIDPG